MELFLCPVCSKSDECDVLLSGKMLKSCDRYDYNGKAAWMFYGGCPKCPSGGMLSQDKFGAYCVISSCDFEQKYGEEHEK